MFVLSAIFMHINCLITFWITEVLCKCSLLCHIMSSSILKWETLYTSVGTVSIFLNLQIFYHNTAKTGFFMTNKLQANGCLFCKIKNPKSANSMLPQCKFHKNNKLRMWRCTHTGIHSVLLKHYSTLSN